MLRVQHRVTTAEHRGAVACLHTKLDLKQPRVVFVLLRGFLIVHNKQRDEPAMRELFCFAANHYIRLIADRHERAKLTLYNRDLHRTSNRVALPHRLGLTITVTTGLFQVATPPCSDQ